MTFEDMLQDEQYKSPSEQASKETMEKCIDTFADILSNIPHICGRGCPVKCNWGTELSCKDMCRKWLTERLKGNEE